MTATTESLLTPAQQRHAAAIYNATEAARRLLVHEMQDESPAIPLSNAIDAHALLCIALRFLRMP
jgi:hypothetical protein